MALLGVGVTVMTPCGEVVPPNVARRLATKGSKFSGVTYTWVVAYCGPTVTFGVAVAAWAMAGVTPGHSESRALPTLTRTATTVTARDLVIRIGISFRC